MATFREGPVLGHLTLLSAHQANVLAKHKAIVPFPRAAKAPVKRGYGFVYRIIQFRCYNFLIFFSYSTTTGGGLQNHPRGLNRVPISDLNLRLRNGTLGLHLCIPSRAHTRIGSSGWLPGSTNKSSPMAWMVWVRNF